MKTKEISFKELRKKDQYHIGRWEKYYSDKEFYKINNSLVKEVKSLIKKKRMKTGEDYFTAAIIFHHSNKLPLVKMALDYSKKSYKIGYKKAKTLIAQATDRILQIQGKKQKFGTQATKMKNGKWKIWPLEGTITDKERKAHGLPSLKYLTEYLNK